MSAAVEPAITPTARVASRRQPVGVPFRSLARGPYGLLLVWLLALCLLAPLIDGTGRTISMFDLMICVIMLSGLHAAQSTRRALVAATALIVSDLFSHWNAIAIPDEVSFLIHYTINLLILLFVTHSILTHIIADNQVTIETLKAAVCVYLLLGLVWLYIYALIDVLIPGSFLIRRQVPVNRFGHLVVGDSFAELLYFSYTTMTTLGFGDILPLSNFARTFSYLEAIVGQIFLTILIARLVGMHITRSSREG